jgi:hypothetical protein
MPEPHFYKELDKDSRLELNASLREIAEQLVEMNHGVHRLLSHLIDVRRERLARKIMKYRESDETLDIAESVEQRGDPLADGLEALLKADLT